MYPCHILFLPCSPAAEPTHQLLVQMWASAAHTQTYTKITEIIHVPHFWEKTQQREPHPFMSLFSRDLSRQLSSGIFPATSGRCIYSALKTWGCRNYPEWGREKLCLGLKMFHPEGCWRFAQFLQAEGAWLEQISKIKRNIYSHIRNVTEGIRALKLFSA